MVSSCLWIYYAYVGVQVCLGVCVFLLQSLYQMGKINTHLHYLCFSCWKAKDTIQFLAKKKTPFFPVHFWSSYLWRPFILENIVSSTAHVDWSTGPQPSSVFHCLLVYFTTESVCVCVCVFHLTTQSSLICQVHYFSYHQDFKSSPC